MFITLQTISNPSTGEYYSNVVDNHINTDHIVSVLSTLKSFTIFLGTGNRLQFTVESFGSLIAFKEAMDIVMGGINGQSKA